MACHDVCNENVDFELLDRLNDIKQAGMRYGINWVRSQWPHLFQSPYINPEVVEAKLEESK